MEWKGVGTELAHSFFSPGLRKRIEAMILYYNTEGYIRRIVVKWLPLIFHVGGERGCRMKSFRFGEGSLFDIVSALAP
jgi:hypothetical protein